MVDKIQVFQYNPTKWYFSNLLKVVKELEKWRQKGLKKRRKREKKKETRRAPKAKSKSRKESIDC